MEAKRARAVRTAVSASLATWWLLVAPQLARACAVCFGDGESDWTGAFVAGTIFMLALPPSIVVIAGVLIYRATKRQEARQAAADANAQERADKPRLNEPHLRVVP
jgi:hypothetical protein